MRDRSTLRVTGWQSRHPNLPPLPLAGEVAVSAAGEGLAGISRIARFRFDYSNLHGPLSRAYSPTSPLKGAR